MGTEVAIKDEDSALGRIVISESQVELIKHTVAVGATDDELKLFFYECRRRGVHPLDRLIHFVKRGQGEKAKASFQAGIDFLRSQAEETGEYRGQEDIEYGPLVAVKEHSDTHAPEWAKSAVRRYDPLTGQTYTTSAIAYWDEYYPGEALGFMWRKIPRVMLAKCAESQALRKAFPKKLAGLYSFEEMEQADMVDVTPKTAKPPVQQPKSKSGNGSDKATVVDLSAFKKDTAMVERVESGEGKKPWKILTEKKTYSTFSATLGAQAALLEGQACTLYYKQNGDYSNLEAIEPVTEPTGAPIPTE